MRVRSLVSEAGARFEVQPGDIVEYPDEIALARIAEGVAEPEIPLVEAPVIPNPPRSRRGNAEAQANG
jgi:hypothetical protein